MDNWLFLKLDVSGLIILPVASHVEFANANFSQTRLRYQQEFWRNGLCQLIRAAIHLLKVL